MSYKKTYLLDRPQIIFFAGRGWHVLVSKVTELVMQVYRVVKFSKFATKVWPYMEILKGPGTS